MLPELASLERVLELGHGHVQVQQLGRVNLSPARQYPLYGVSLGNPAAHLPVVGYFGGVHGLERIGAEVVIAFLHSLVMRLQWDSTLHRQLEDVHMVFMPLVNPGGLALVTRANPAGVDLMRNSPVQAREPTPWLVGGQRVSARLPWYQGPEGEPMQAEAQALCDWVRAHFWQRPFAISVDCHSGFGARDRLWFPYAHAREPIPHLAEVMALRQVLDRSHAQHRYIVEPQSAQYLTHGDLWDYLYLESLAQPELIFLPLTLEMGSWLWVKKNPRQLFSRHGIFNPLIAHRQQRVLRQHQTLLDFLARAAASYRRWLPLDSARVDLHAQALQAWF